MTTQAPLITAGEYLLIIADGYLREAEVQTDALTVDALLDELAGYDDVNRVLVWDPVRNGPPDDITADCAERWWNTGSGGVEDAYSDAVPLFVRNHPDFDDWAMDWEAEGVAHAAMRADDASLQLAGRV